MADRADGAAGPVAVHTDGLADGNGREPAAGGSHSDGAAAR
jgi:hypothetical protein